MPTLDATFLEPLWAAFSAFLPEHIDTHPYGGHNPRTDDRLIFERLLEVVINGRSYESASVPGASASTLRRRRDEWIEHGVFEKLKNEALRSYDKVLGLDFSDISIDGCITKASCGGELAGRSPVDRGKGGIKRHLLVDGKGIPIYTILVPANRNDCILLADTLDGLEAFADLLPDPGAITVHLDAGYDYPRTLKTIDERGYKRVVSQRGTPLQAGKRWKAERAHSWFHDYAAMRRCRERKADVYVAWVQLVNALIVIKKIVTESWCRYRWEGRPEKWKRAWGRSTAQKIKRSAATQRSVRTQQMSQE